MSLLEGVVVIVGVVVLWTVAAFVLGTLIGRFIAFGTRDEQ